VFSSAQINYTTWKENIGDSSNLQTESSDDGKHIIIGSKQSLTLASNQIEITIDYCNDRITTNFVYNDQKINHIYSFDFCGLESWKLDKKIYFGRSENNGLLYRYIEYDKTLNHLEIIEEHNKKTRTVTRFYGEELSINELGSKCKKFYDQPIDTTLYHVDLSLLEGKWFSQKDSSELTIKLDQDTSTNALFSLCDVMKPTKGISGEIQRHSNQSGLEYFNFYACVSANYEVRMQLEFDGIGDDVFIRKLTENELILDYIFHYIVLKRQE
jgi:hypothetical protein